MILTTLLHLLLYTSSFFLGLVNVSCHDEHDVGFQNFRMLQGLGATLAFSLGSVICVEVKLYIIISLLILAIMCYVVAEYRIRRDEERMAAAAMAGVSIPPQHHT